MKKRKEKENCVLFLHGRYPGKHQKFYEKLCRSRFKVAVDGGYSFFKKTGIIPDLLIGDFDSLKPFPTSLSSKTEVIRHPTDKDKTDAQLALEHCILKGAREIDIVQPNVGELDQLLGNLMLLSLPRMYESLKLYPFVRIVNHAQEVFFLDGTTLIIERAVGDRVSVVPVSRKVTYSCRGCQYEIDGVRLRMGETLALRNRIVADPAEFRVKGQAFLIRRYSRKRGPSTGSEG
jgi:thiamine pyrophosphokinase